MNKVFTFLNKNFWRFNLMKKMKFLAVVMLIAAALVAFAACSSGEEQPAGDDTQAETKTTLRIGTEPVARIMAESAIEPLEEMGYEVEIVMFDDYFTPNVALDEGQIDANFYQHQPFLDNYNKENGTDIVMLAPCFLYYGGIYSENYDSLDDLKENGVGGTFVIAQDASNQSLEDKDLYGIADIVDNPYEFEFLYMDDNTKYSSRDEFAAYTGSSNTMATFGIDPSENQLYYIDHSSEALGVCVNAEDADTQWAQDLVTAYTSDAAKQYVEENTNGANIPVE